MVNARCKMTSRGLKEAAKRRQKHQAYSSDHILGRMTCKNFISALFHYILICISLILDSLLPILTALELGCGMMAVRERTCFSKLTEMSVSFPLLSGALGLIVK